MAEDHTTLRRCSRCEEMLPRIAFSRRTAAADGLHPWCKPCGNAYKRERLSDPTRAAAHREWRRQHDGYDRTKRARYLYGDVDLDAMLASQNSRCAVCQTTEPGGRWGTWHVDHDHACCPTMKSCGRCVRGLLCANCNTALGKFGDDTEVIARALAYLKASRR